jgi:hypothetical protein
MVVIGGSRGVGRQIVEVAIRNGARVLAVARQEGPLRQLAQNVCATEILSLDATDEGAPSKAFGVLQPHILVLCAGAFTPAAPLHEQSWREFAVNWETDFKMASHFCKAALTRLTALFSGRSKCSRNAIGGRPPAADRPNPAQQRLLGRYLQAGEGHDLDGFMALLREDATYTMPPWQQWYEGREAIRSFFVGLEALQRSSPGGDGSQRATRFRRLCPRWRGRAIGRALHPVLAIEQDMITTLTLFVPPTGPRLFHAFGLLLTLPDAASAELVYTPYHS